MNANRAHDKYRRGGEEDNSTSKAGGFRIEEELRPQQPEGDLKNSGEELRQSEDVACRLCGEPGARLNDSSIDQTRAATFLKAPICEPGGTCERAPNSPRLKHRMP